ncbi:permease-like cell division protein FtsX [Candidatus Saccharibacteria bacterium TM7i]|nr:permease-like cell division protein FtsX [Candidatus Saccharibacteria bacterium TM7i]
MGKKKKVDSKVLSQQKARRRQWITFVRMCRYGVNNFSRNAWLTIAATAVMTITLLVILASVIAQSVLNSTLEDFRDKVSMSIYLKNQTKQEDVNKVVAEVNKLDSVIETSVKTPAQAREEFIQANKNSSNTLDAIKEASNQFFWTISIKVVDINDTSQLVGLVENSKTVKEHLDPGHAPSFAGDRRASIESIARTATFLQRIGIIASSVFVVISTLIIFNTIRMAIFNRREEIQMMKLIGADRSFIRGPFIVEAVVYGVFAALIATGLGYTLLYLAAPALRKFGVAVEPTLQLGTYYIGFVLLAMIIVGALIGVVSSVLATRRYLKPNS